MRVKTQPMIVAGARLVTMMAEARGGRSAPRRGAIEYRTLTARVPHGVTLVGASFASDIEVVPVDRDHLRTPEVRKPIGDEK